MKFCLIYFYFIYFKKKKKNIKKKKKKKKKGQENLAFFYKQETRDMNRLVLRRALNFPAQFHNSADFSKRNAEEP